MRWHINVVARSAASGVRVNTASKVPMFYSQQQAVAPSNCVVWGHLAIKKADETKQRSWVVEGNHQFLPP